MPEDFLDWLAELALDNYFYPALHKLEQALVNRSLLQRTLAHDDSN